MLSAICGTTSTLETTTFFPLSSAQGSPSLSTCQKSRSTTAALGFLPRRKVPTLVLVVAQPEEQTVAGPQHSTLFLLYLPGVQEVLILAAFLSFLSGHWSYASSPLPLHFKSVDAHGRKKGLPCSAGFVICSILKYIPKMPHIFTRETRRKEQKATGRWRFSISSSPPAHKWWGTVLPAPSSAPSTAQSPSLPNLCPAVWAPTTSVPLPALQATPYEVTQELRALHSRVSMSIRWIRFDRRIVEWISGLEDPSTPALLEQTHPHCTQRESHEQKARMLGSASTAKPRPQPTAALLPSAPIGHHSPPGGWQPCVGQGVELSDPEVPSSPKIHSMIL